MTTGSGNRSGYRGRIGWLAGAVLLLAALLAAAFWLLPHTRSREAATPSLTRPPLTLVPTFTAAPAASPTPVVLHPTIIDMAAEVDDDAGTITFRLGAQVPGDRQVAEAILWYDTEAGHRLHRIAGSPSSTLSLSYRLDGAQDGLTRTLTTTALDYWWLVRDTAGESVRAGGIVPLGPRLQALQATATPEPPSIDFSWSVSDTQHFQFHYAPDTAAERDLPQIGSLAEAAFERTRSVLGTDFDGQMRVFLVPRVFWQGAATYGDKVQLISYLDRNYTDVELWSYFTHEGTHALGQDMIRPTEEEGGPDGVLVEGMAVWASSGHYGQEPVDAWAAVVAASDAYIPLAKLRAGPFYDFQHEISYIEAGSFVQYLVDRYGWAGFKELYGQATGKAQHDEELVNRLFGQGYTALDAGWLAYLESLSPTPEEAETWNLTVRSFDLMRRYETEMDPDARILPDKSPTDWTSDTLKVFLRQRQEPANVVLETALIAAQEHLKSGDFDGAGSLLDDVEASLNAGGKLVRPSLAVRLAILEGLANQDRAVLRADRQAYLQTCAAAFSPPSTLTETLQLPFIAYRQEMVRLDIAGDGQSAQGTVLLHAKVAGGEYPEDGRLFALAFVLQDRQWRMASRQPAEVVLGLPPS